MNRRNARFYLKVYFILKDSIVKKFKGALNASRK